MKFVKFWCGCAREIQIVLWPRPGRQADGKAAEIRRVAEAKGWLDVEAPLPGNDVLSQAIGIRSSSVVTRHSQSCVEPYREQVKAWADQGVACTTIYQALVRNHQFSGGYSSVYRFVCGLRPPTPPKATIKLDFAPGEVAQVDFGTGPRLVDTRTGKEIKSWFFLMTLAFSRHQYAEIVLNQKTVTWLECHRHAFEFFGGVMGRVMIDNAKCAITKACYHDPVVQRAYAEYAEGYGFKIDALPPRQPQLKGRVESGIKYLKKGFMPTRQFRHLHDANQQLQQWILGQAATVFMGPPVINPLPCLPSKSRYSNRSLAFPRWWRHGPRSKSTAMPISNLRRVCIPCRIHWYPKPSGSRPSLHPADLSGPAISGRPCALVYPGSRHTVDDHLPPNAWLTKCSNRPGVSHRRNGSALPAIAWLISCSRTVSCITSEPCRGSWGWRKPMGQNASTTPANGRWTSTIRAMAPSSRSSIKDSISHPIHSRRSIPWLTAIPVRVDTAAIPQQC